MKATVRNGCFEFDGTPEEFVRLLRAETEKSVARSSCAKSKVAQKTVLGQTKTERLLAAYRSGVRDVSRLRKLSGMKNKNCVWARLSSMRRQKLIK